MFLKQNKHTFFSGSHAMGIRPLQWNFAVGKKNIGLNSEYSMINGNL